MARPVEEHPDYPEWATANEHLIATKEALKRGDASQVDVDLAQATYDFACKKIDRDA